MRLNMKEALFNSFSGVVITGDLIRPFKVGGSWESGSWKNIRWLYHILEKPLKLAGYNCSQLIWDQGYSNSPRQYFNTPSLYAELGLEINYQNWANLSCKKSAPVEIINRLKHLQGKLVIGYEMPDIMLAAFRQLNIVFVDIALHPIRFLEDLVFGMRSNSNEIQDYFKGYALESSTVDQNVSKLKAKLNWIT